MFQGATCKCGCGALWQSSLTLFERFMFWSGFWTRFDFTNVMGVTAPLGGEVNAHARAMDKISEPVKE